MENKYEGYYGIDLGTTNSIIAALDKNGRPYIIPNKDGQLLTPSFIRFYKNKSGNVVYQIGQKAKDVILRPQHKDETVLFSYKTKMGQEGIKGVAGEVFGREIRSEQCSQLSLQYLRESIEKEFPNTPIKRVVVTVPAYFETKQKEATKQVALKVFNSEEDKRLRKFTKVDIISEPLATILSYSEENENGFKEPKAIMVYDLGGGTFDISLALVYNKMNLKENTEELSYMTLDESGNKSLGGDDIDKALFYHVKKYLQTKENVPAEVIDEHKDYITQQLEQLKIKLCNKIKENSSSASERVTIRINNKNSYTISISKKTFQDLINPIINITLENVREVMNRVNSATGEEIDSLLLVGGSTKNPIVYQILKSEFPKLNILPNVADPDKAIALGAAEMVKMLADNKDNNIASILTRDIGVKSYNGEIFKFFKKGTQLPCKFMQEFTNSVKGAPILIDIYEGNTLRYDEPGANKLGSLVLDVPPDKEVDTHSVLVTLEILKDYTTKVTTMDTLNKVKTITIKRDGLTTESDEAISQYSEETRKDSKNLDTFKKLELGWKNIK